jgi:hypothetical protein
MVLLGSPVQGASDWEMAAGDKTHCVGNDLGWSSLPT